MLRWKKAGGAIWTAARRSHLTLLDGSETPSVHQNFEQCITKCVFLMDALGKGACTGEGIAWRYLVFATRMCRRVMSVTGCALRIVATFGMAVVEASGISDASGNHLSKRNC
jgi:hypothetical protein